MKKKLLLLSIVCILAITANSQTSFWPNQSVVVIKNSDTLDLAWAGGINFAQFSTVDLNLDGKEDLVFFDRTDYLVSTFLNVGDSGEIKYQYAPEYIQKFPKSTGWLLMRDFNCDGKKDVFYCQSGGVMSVSENVSSSSLQFNLVNGKVPSDQFPGGSIGIYIPSGDIPSISDVDFDGDLDIITFGVLGTSLEYHRNYSQELYGTCDSLSYTLKNYCWGHFLEVGINTNKLVLFDTCSFNVPNPEGLGGNVERHVGSTVTAIFENGDSAVDLLLGDVTFDNVVLGTNGGTKPNKNTSVTSQDTTFPSYDVPVDLTLFPGTFLEDMDNDGIKDLVVSPNTAELAENDNSVWFYHNSGTDFLPVFEFVKKNLLQDEMIEMGQNSIPELFDYNADGLMDLVISNYGFYNSDSVTYDCRLTLYKNIGTLSNPVFEFVTDDYQNLSALKLGNSLHPTFADIDGDNDQDMILGNSEGYLHFFTNTAGSGNTAVFSMTSARLQSNLGDTIDVGQFSAPQLFDYDNDGDFDLVIGKVNGSIRYYENIGTTSAYSFKKITESMGRVEIHEIWDIYGAATGFNTPRFYRNGGTVTLYCGSQSGGVYKFTGINTSNPFQTYIIDTVMKNKIIGIRSTPIMHDFKNDGKLDMIVGNGKGGLNFYTMSNGHLSIDKIEPKLDFKLYPNPATESIFIEIDNQEFTNNSIRIFSIEGKLIKQQPLTSSRTNIQVSNLPKGVYFLTVTTDQGQRTKRFIVQ